MAGLPALVLGGQRPFDAQALRAQSTGCRPVEAGPGLFWMPTCGAFPVLRTSPNIPLRRMSLRPDAPFAVDLRQQGLDGPVKDQQQVGVCWSFALSTIMENGARRQARGEIVAPLHLISSDAWSQIWSHGKTDRPIVLEASWPYDPVKACKLKEEPDGWCEQAYHVRQGSWREDPMLVSEVETANQRGVVSIVKTEKVEPTFDGLAARIAEGQSVYLSFRIDDANWQHLRTDSLPDYVVEDGGAHAVVAMGYRAQGPRGREILIHNSWGPEWGDGGFAWITENTLQAHAMDAFAVDVELPGSAGPTTATNTPFPIPIPGNLSIPGIPGLSLPSLPTLPGGDPKSTPAPSAACAAGQVRDAVTGACSAPCGNGLPPAAGACLPF